MSEEFSSTTPASRSLPREVQLIALLLLFKGATDLFMHLSGGGIYGLLLFPHFRLLIWDTLLPSLLGLAGIIIGIALLVRARWALWGGIALLAVTVIEQFFYNFIWHLVSSFTTWGSHGEGTPNLVSMYISILLSIAVPLVMLYFLTTPRAFTAWETEDRTGVLTRWNTAIGRRLPVDTPPVVLLIGLMLLCWAGGELIPLLFAIPAIVPQFSFYRNPEMRWLLITMSFGLAGYIGYLVSGFGLLRHARWAAVLAIIALIAVLVPVLWMVIHVFLNPAAYRIADLTSREFARNSVIISNLLHLVAGLLINGTLIYFLLNVRRGEGKPVSDEALTTQG